MTKLFHSIPWTLALTLAAQAGEGEAVRIPDVSSSPGQESSLDSGAPDGPLAGNSSDSAPDAAPMA